MSEPRAKTGLHVATLSGWYRFEYDGGQWRQANRDLTYWTLTCMSVDPQNSAIIWNTPVYSTRITAARAGSAPIPMFLR